MSLIESLVVERYKHVIEQQRRLDSAATEQLRLFEKGGAAMISAAAAVIGSREALRIEPQLAFDLVKVLMGAFWFLGLFTIAAIAVGMASWWDYRKEEAELANSHTQTQFRVEPKKANFYRWRESWIIMFVTATLLFVQFFGMPFAERLMIAKP